MNEELVQWSDPEPGQAPSGPPVTMVKVRASHKVIGFFVSEQVQGVATHWMGGRTKPCTGTKNGCEGCAIGLPIRQKGYIAVITDTTGRVRLLEITEKAFDTNLRLCGTEGLRGLRFEASRTGKTDNSGLKVDIFDQKHDADKLPPDINVRAVLCRVWFGREKRKVQ